MPYGIRWCVWAVSGTIESRLIRQILFIYQLLEVFCHSYGCHVWPCKTAVKAGYCCGCDVAAHDTSKAIVELAAKIELCNTSN